MPGKGRPKKGTDVGTPFGDVRVGKKGRKSTTTPPEENTVTVTLGSNSTATPPVQRDDPSLPSGPLVQFWEEVSEEDLAAYVRPSKKGRKSMAVPPERNSTPTPPVQLNAAMPSEPPIEEGLRDGAPPVYERVVKKGKKSMTVAPERKSMPMPPLRLNIPKPSEVPSDVYEIPSDDIPFTYMRPGKKGKKSITVPPERSSTPIPLEGNSMPTPTVQHDAPMPLEQPTQVWQGVSEETASAFVHAGKKGTKSMVVPPERISMPVPPRGLNIPKRSEVSAELYEELCEEVPFKLASPFKKGKSMTVPPERSSTPMPTEGNSMPMPRGQLDAPPPLEPTTEEEYGDGAYVRAGKGGTNFVPIPPERNFMPIPTEGNSMAMSSDGNSMPMHPVQPNAPMQLEPPTDVSNPSTPRTHRIRHRGPSDWYAIPPQNRQHIEYRVVYPPPPPPRRWEWRNVNHYGDAQQYGSPYPCNPPPHHQAPHNPPHHAHPRNIQQPYPYQPHVMQSHPQYGTDHVPHPSVVYYPPHSPNRDPNRSMSSYPPSSPDHDPYRSMQSYQPYNPNHDPDRPMQPYQQYNPNQDPNRPMQSYQPYNPNQDPNRPMPSYQPYNPNHPNSLSYNQTSNGTYVQAGDIDYPPHEQCAVVNFPPYPPNVMVAPGCPSYTSVPSPMKRVRFLGIEEFLIENNQLPDENASSPQTYSLRNKGHLERHPSCPQDPNDDQDHHDQPSTSSKPESEGPRATRQP